MLGIIKRKKETVGRVLLSLDGHEGTACFATEWV